MQIKADAVDKTARAQLVKTERAKQSREVREKNETKGNIEGLVK